MTFHYFERLLKTARLTGIDLRGAIVSFDGDYELIEVSQNLL
jgi:hypothetical protein